MFGNSRTCMTEEKGILVLTATGGWRVEKGGHFLTGTWPEVLSTKATAPGASLFPWLVVVKVWGMPSETAGW